MNQGQYEGIMGALEKILDRMPVREIPPVVEPVQYNVSGTHRHRASCHGSAGELICRNEDQAPEIDYAEQYGYDPGPTKLNAQGWPVPVGTPSLRKGSEMAADKRQALAIMRAVLDDWIKGAKGNHEACQHRYENRGEECWRTFAPSDIRNMINDAARELGVDEFPCPEVAEKDKKP